MTEGQCDKLYEVYLKIKNHTSPALGLNFNPISLSTVNQEFGNNYLKAISSYPHIVWVPTEDSNDAPRLNAYPAIVSGQRVSIEGIRTRIAGCDLHIFHRDYISMEILINDLQNALYDVLLAAGNADDPRNFSIGPGRWVEKSDFVKENTVYYIQSITVQIPIYRMIPMAIVETVTNNLPT